jgi:hypothetical protein
MDENTFTATFGLVPGYFVSQQDGADTINFGSLWQLYMQKEYEESGIVVSVVANESKTVYPVAFGSPLGGEVTITVSGVMNPEYFKDSGLLYFADLAMWRAAVLRVVEAVKKALTQTTVTIIFSESRVVYLKG